MDKTVRLWHTSRSECLCAFKHSDIVSSVSFHPRDDRFFLAGSLDAKLRLWSIPDKSVACWSQTSDLITAVAFTPDGKTSIAGCLTGGCLFYETESLRLQTQMHVRSAHGKNAKGSKITGIQSINCPPTDPSGDVKLLITSNDARARVYNFRDKSLELKLKGPENSTSQIRASFSDDARYIISGSENRRVYIWRMSPIEKERDRSPWEAFDAHLATVTATVMAPERTRQLLQLSRDPLFDLCNPPPVQLLSRTESRPSSTVEVDRPDSIPPAPSKCKQEESPAYLARSGHKNGNVIITADYQGHIKVFRQDCAYKQRLRNNDSWDTSSAFSKKLVQRSSSIATHGSRHSTLDSVSHPSERILSWRQSIDLNSSANTSLEGFNTPVSRRNGYGRSRSPRKSFAKSGSQIFSASATTTPSLTPSIQQHSQANNPPRTSLNPTPHESDLMSSVNGGHSPLPNVGASHDLQDNQRQERKANDIHDEGPESVDTRQNLNSSDHLVRPRVDRDRGTALGLFYENEDSAVSSGAEEGIHCRRCGGEDFKGRKRAGRNVLVCGRCGLIAE